MRTANNHDAPLQVRDVATLFLSITVAQLAGAIGALLTFPAIPAWYDSLAKPTFNPPSWLFSPVWTLLYTLMGIAMYLVWRKRGTPQARTALWLYGVQLLLNVFWSLIFFGLRSPGGAFFAILLLWLGIYTTIIAFSHVSRTAAWLLIPYIAWVSFAAYLNLAIWILNR